MSIAVVSEVNVFISLFEVIPVVSIAVVSKVYVFISLFAGLLVV